MLFITSTTNATRHAVYAIERNPPATIRATGATVVALVEQFPWGPEGVYTCSGIKDFIDKYAPGGFDRTGAGYMAVIGKAWPVLKVVRVTSATAAKAAVILASVTPTNIVTVTAKYKGVAGNSLTCTVADATDGDANHFNLTVAISTAYGTTQDKFENLNYSATGTHSVPTFTGTYLTGAITWIANGRPVNGTTSMTGGLDSSTAVVAADYVGTQGSANKGIALLEADKNIDLVMTGIPLEVSTGTAARDAVNVGLKAHADYMTDRIACISGVSGLAASAARTDVIDYRSLRVCYQDNWAYQADDVDGTLRLVSPAVHFATVAANISPSTSPAWKGATVQALLGSIVSLETPRGDDAYQNELAGINTLQREENGGYTFECAVNTYAPTDPSKKSYKRTRMGHYIVKAVVGSLREFVDSPNVDFNQQDEVNAVDEFLSGLKRNVKIDPNNLPHIVDFGIRPLTDFNSEAELAAGQFTIPADVKISSDQSRIFFSLQIGETVKIQLDL